jgi:4-hydroxy-tetrahydrodipicolinate reductase
MDTIIFGNGNLGRAISAALIERGESPPRLLARPTGDRHDATGLIGVDLAFEASRAEAVVPNLAAALAAGCRRFIVATTGWDDGRSALHDALCAHGASAVVAPNFSLGVAIFLRIVDVAGGLFGPLDAFEPFVVEWHRRGKADRPSGTAREIARRLLAARPARWRLPESTGGGGGPDVLELVGIRAGASPGMHLVGFDAPGETIELRHTARDRSAYASGALAAADWLRAAPRPPGIHDFDEVVDSLLEAAPRPLMAA